MFKPLAFLAGSLVALGLVAAPAFAQQGKGTSGYLTDTRNAIIKDPYNLCWRTGYWTPAIANCECDKDLLPKQVCEPPPPPKPAAAPAARPPPPGNRRATVSAPYGAVRGARILTVALPQGSGVTTVTVAPLAATTRTRVVLSARSRHPMHVRRTSVSLPVSRGGRAIGS